MKTPTLEQVDAYEVPSFLAARIAQVNDVPLDFAEGLMKEAKRMLYLCVVSNEAVAPSDRVDWAWHEMLMFTQFYRDFSNFIGSFIHHVPNPPQDTKPIAETWESIQATLGEKRRGSETYNKTKENYMKYFKEEVDPLYWP